MRRCLMTAVIAFATVGACSRQQPSIKTSDVSQLEGDRITRRAPGEVCQDLLTRIERADRGGKPADALRDTTALISYLRRTPLRVLQPCEDAIALRLSSGRAPMFASVVIDHQHRLGRLASQAGEARVLRFAKAVRTALSTQTIDRRSQRRTLVRNSRDSGFLVYSDNVTLAIAFAATTKVGQSMYARGGRPEDVLRLVEQVRQCGEASKDPAAARTFVEAISRCELLAATMEQSGNLKDLQGAATMLGSRLGRTTSACVDSLAEDATSEALASIEDLAECMALQQSGHGPGGFDPWSGLASGSDTYAPHKDGSPAVKQRLEGYTQTGREDYDWSRTGSTGHTSEFTYKDDEGGSITVYEVGEQKGETWASSTTEIYTVVIEETSSGDITTRYDSEGNMTEQLTLNNDGTGLQQKFDADGNVIAQVESSGTQFKVTETSDGESKTSTYESNAVGLECKTGCEDPAVYDENNTLPPEGSIMSTPCAEYALGAPKKEAPVAPSDPAIDPLPDQGSTTLDDACIQGIVSAAPTQCAPSVALCVEPPPPGQCGCGGVPRAAVVATHSGRCAAMSCGPNATCDPSTGTCSTGIAGEPAVPGVAPPFLDSFGRQGPGGEPGTPIPNEP